MDDQSIGAAETPWSNLLARLDDLASDPKCIRADFNVAAIREAVEDAIRFRSLLLHLEFDGHSHWLPEWFIDGGNHEAAPSLAQFRESIDNHRRG